MGWILATSGDVMAQTCFWYSVGLSINSCFICISVWILIVPVNNIPRLLAVTSSGNQKPKAFAALGSQVRPRLGEGSLQRWHASVGRFDSPCNIS